MAKLVALARQLGKLGPLAGLSLLPASCDSPTEPADSQYEVQLLGTLTPGRSCCSEAFAVNRDGIVVGVGSFSPGRAFRWSAQKGMEDLGTLGGREGAYREAAAYDINERGDIVGFSDDAAGSNHHAVLWAGGVLTDLAVGCESRERCRGATAINDSGWVVGFRQVAPSYGVEPPRPFIWRDGQISDLEPSGAFEEVLAINNIGHVVGRGSGNVGAVWDGTTVQSLESSLDGVPFGPSIALSVNDLGQVVGWGYRGAGSQTPWWGSDRVSEFLFQDGRLQELPTLGGQGAHATGISRLGEIVGGAQDSSGIYHAVLWRELRPIALPLPPGAVSAQARDINAAGVIVGVAVLDSRLQEYQAVVWTPIRP